LSLGGKAGGLVVKAPYDRRDRENKMGKAGQTEQDMQNRPVQAEQYNINENC
jgi:hypothetical protein